MNAGRTILWTAAMTAALASSAYAGQNEKRLAQMSTAERRILETTAALSPQSLNDIAAATAPEALRARAADILAPGNLAIGSRPVDTNGQAAIHRYLRERIRALEPQGVRFIGSLKTTVAVPVSLDRLADPAKREPPAHVTIGELSIPVHAIWPNGAMPSLCPEGGLKGPLVAVGAGEWSDIKGLDLSDAIAVMTFRGGRNWDRLFMLGAQAVIVMEDDYVDAPTAAGLFASAPAPFPRFYVDRANGKSLLGQATRKTLQADGSTRIVPGQVARLEGGQVYENRVAESLFAYLPPTAPVTIEIRPSDLLERIAIENGVAMEDLLKENALSLPSLKPGDLLTIPGLETPYEVKSGDLLQRLERTYAIDSKVLLDANGLTDPELKAGQRLTIPNINDSVLIMARCDSVCMIPDIPHGAMVAANLAATLAMMEHLATAEGGIRRRGVIFAFLDGDNYAGQASRAFAEQILKSDGDLAPPLSTTAKSVTEESVLQNYRAALDGFERAGQSPLSDAAMDWLITRWLPARIEKSRVKLAEARIVAINAQQVAKEPGDLARAQGELRKLDAEIALLVNLRNSTYGDKRRTPPQRMDAFLRKIADPTLSGRLENYDLTRQALVRRMRMEYDEVRTFADQKAGNLALVKAVTALLHPDANDAQKRADWHVPGWLIRLSDGSQTIMAGIPQDGRMMTSPGSGKIQGLIPRFFNVAAYAGVTGGWPEEWTYFDGPSNPDFAVNATTEVAPLYGEFLSAGKIDTAVICTANDRCPRLDTPGDTLANTRFDRLGVQTRTALTLIKTGLEHPAYGPNASAPGQSAPFGRLMGEITQFNIRSGIDAQDPVPQTYVYCPGAGRTVKKSNNQMLAGARLDMLVISRMNGSYQFPVESVLFHNKLGLNNAYAYRLNRKTALFDMVADQAAIGTQRQSPAYSLLASRETEKKIVLTPVYPLVVFADVDPMEYKSLAAVAGANPIVDAVLNGVPRHSAFESPMANYNETDLSSAILYLPPGRSARLLLQDAGRLKLLLTGKLANAKDDKGMGYAVGPRPDGQRNLAMTLTPLRIAEDLQQIATKRSRTYERFGIRDKALHGAIQRSEEKLAQARELAKTRDWQAAIGASRECWGILIKNYPSLMTLGRGAIFSVIFLMALLVLASVFLEQLILGAKGIVGQLAGTVAIFTIGVVFLNYFHPAFSIAVSPLIVIIAFTMILMSLIVLALSHQRFEVLVRRARIAGGEVESEEISLAGSLATAFSLGVANLKKRPSRTVLTTFTVSVLTFSIITFVSVKGQDRVFQRELALERDIEGTTVVAEQPRYDGLLYRNFGWSPISEAFISALRTEYGSRFQVIPRGYYVEAAGGNNADRGSVNQIEITRGGKSVIVNGVMTFDPAEKDVSHLNDAVSGRNWFLPEQPALGRPSDRQHLILPDQAATALGIAESDILDAAGNRRPESELPVVRMMNVAWRVIGILDSRRADCIRDVNGKSLAMVDYLKSGITASATGLLENETQTYHMSWKWLALAPMAARTDLQANYYSVAVRLPPDTDAAPFLKDLSIRQTMAVFAHIDGKTSLLTTRRDQSVGGLAKIVVPIILCILIVAGTMLGTVDERKGEVQMLGAVGLSPAQISLLLMAEATVYSVLGIVFGMFGGLGFGKLLLHYPTLFGDLSINFTSMAATGLAMSTGLIVLIATLVPAKRAAALAAPSGMEKWVLPEPGGGGNIDFHLPFTLTRGNAVGMVAFFRRFLLNHVDATSPDFNCREIRASVRREPADALELTARMWLAPYDLDVAQHLSLRVMPTDHEGVFRVQIRLHRTSGAEDAWLRTNYGFMDQVRRQFLLWRNLSTQLRHQYIAQGREVLGGSAAPENNPTGITA